MGRRKAGDHLIFGSPLRRLFGSLLVTSAVFIACCGQSTRTAPTAPAPAATPRTSASAAPDGPGAASAPRVGSTASTAASSTVVARAGTPGLFVIGTGRVMPDAIAIASGKSVSWRNGDVVPHRIVSDEPGLFETAPFGPDETVSITLSATGIHDWHDPSMPAIRGTIRVIP